MKTAFIAILATVPFAFSCEAAERQLCAGWENAVEPELRITEADLTKAKAEKAAAFMKEYVASNGEKGESNEPFNALLVLEGFARKAQALEEATPEATDDFCSWLTTEAARTE